MEQYHVSVNYKSNFVKGSGHKRYQLPRKKCQLLCSSMYSEAWRKNDALAVKKSLLFFCNSLHNSMCNIYLVIGNAISKTQCGHKRTYKYAVVKISSMLPSWGIATNQPVVRCLHNSERWELHISNN